MKAWPVEGGRAEVDEFDVEMFVDDHVFVFDVAMEDTIGVEVGHCVNDL